jgi:phosphoglycerate kinase
MALQKLTVTDLSLKQQRVLLRVDFNVPLNSDGTIRDDSRIRASLETIRYLLKGGASIVILSHLGRPKGTDPKLTLAPCARRLSQLLDKPVSFLPECVGAAVEASAAALKPGEILMLENVRFHAGEETPDKEPDFPARLARLGTVYVNDAFGTAHRAHASTALIASFFPHKAAAGLLMEKEIAHLSGLLRHPKRPFYAIIGGSKVSTKAGVIERLLSLVDGLFIGGAMVFAFMKAQGFEIGDSLYDESERAVVEKILRSNQASKIHWPTDIVGAQAFADDSPSQIFPYKRGIPKGWRGMDIGPATLQAWTDLLQKSATVFWNGPVGVFEFPSFAQGTRKLAEALANLKAEVVIGGGDSVAAVEEMGLARQFSHLSTGGGASLEFLELGHLPGIDALSDKK